MDDPVLIFPVPMEKPAVGDQSSRNGEALFQKPRLEDDLFVSFYGGGRVVQYE